MKAISPNRRLYDRDQRSFRKGIKGTINVDSLPTPTTPHTQIALICAGKV
jgi:hypothetical protein